MTDAFLRFMSSSRGRYARLAVGAALLAWGLVAFATIPGKLAALVALAPLASGLSNRCVLPQPSERRALP